MSGTYTHHAVERIGENLHLLLLFAIGITVAVRNRSKNPRVAGLVMTAFLLLILSVVAGGLLYAWMDIFGQGYANLPQLGYSMTSTILSGLHFFSTVVGWVFLILGLSQAFKSNPAPPVA